MQTETRSIALPKGGTLDVEIMPGFYDVIRKRFNLSSDEAINDDHIRMFVFGSFKTAIDKVEVQGEETVST